MGWEEHARCRYYPNCMIHTWRRFTRDVGLAERIQITEAYTRGVRPRAIARRHNLTIDQVWKISTQKNTKIKKP